MNILRKERQNMKNDLEIGNRIREIREELHMSRNTFSEKINISESYLAQLELGNKSIGINTLLAICAYTGCSADYLLFGEEGHNDTSKKIIRIINHLPEKSLNLSYEILRSIKAHSDN